MRVELYGCPGGVGYFPLTFKKNLNDDDNNNNDNNKNNNNNNKNNNNNNNNKSFIDVFQTNCYLPVKSGQKYIKAYFD